MSKSPPRAQKRRNNKKAAQGVSPQFFPTVKAANDLQTITFSVKFYGGAGGIIFTGDGLNDREVDRDEIFSIQQKAGDQTVDVGGTAPAGDCGRIEVEVSNDKTVLSAFENNVFKAGVINSNILYTVK